MPLEATVICLDNSDWMRNGDYTPTRWEAQNDAINLLCGAKTQSNPENTVALVAGAGRSPEVLVTLTSDLGKVLSSLHGVKVGGTLDFEATLQVAQLVLKHRQNKNQQQRIVAFVGSPIQTDSENLVRLAKRLKKNNIAVDIVNFGEEAVNTQKLEDFKQAVNSNDNSHLVTIPPGPHILSEILISSPIVTGGEGGGNVGFGAPGGGDDFGIDPSLDPELAMAIRVSLEEERARQAAAKQDTQPNTTSQSDSAPAPALQQPQEQPKPQTQSQEQPKPQAQPQEQPKPQTQPTPAQIETADVMEEDLLEQAIALSMQGAATTSAPSTASAPSPAPAVTPVAPIPATKEEEMKELTEEEEMQMALAMSMHEQPAAATTEEKVDPEVAKVMEDPNWVQSVLSTLPGVDPNDARIQEVLKNLEKQNKKEDKK